MASIVLAALAPPLAAAALLIGLALLAVWHRPVLSWSGLLVVLALVVMFVPIRRYDIPVGLPFALEPYRVLLIVVIAVLFTALLVDPRMRLRRLGFGGVVVGYLAAAVLSVALNVGPLAEAGLANAAVGAVVNLLFLFSTFLIVRLLLTSATVVIRLLMALVGAGAVVGLAAVVERATTFNVFLNLHAVLPLRLMAEASGVDRGGGLRAFASAGHPIALAAVLTLLLPIAIYLGAHSPWPSRPHRRVVLWTAAAVLLVAGSVVTVSHTGFVMLAVMAVAAAVLAPRVLPRVALAGFPALLALLALAPTALVGLVRSFLDPDQLLAQQYAAPGMTGSGRLADLGPGLADFALRPVAGTGVGSRIVTGPDRNAGILDNQYLSTALEAGLVGVIALVALSLVPAVRMARRARDRRCPPARRDLAAALSTAFWGYGASLFFYDGLGFYQALMVFLMLLAVAGWFITEGGERSPLQLPLQERRSKPLASPTR